MGEEARLLLFNVLKIYLNNRVRERDLLSVILFLYA